MDLKVVPKIRSGTGGDRRRSWVGADGFDLDLRDRRGLSWRQQPCLVGVPPVWRAGRLWAGGGQDLDGSNLSEGGDELLAQGVEIVDNFLSVHARPARPGDHGVHREDARDG